MRGNKRREKRRKKERIQEVKKGGGEMGKGNERTRGKMR